MSHTTNTSPSLAETFVYIVRANSTVTAKKARTVVYNLGSEETIIAAAILSDPREGAEPVKIQDLVYFKANGAARSKWDVQRVIADKSPSPKEERLVLKAHKAFEVALRSTNKARRAAPALRPSPCGHSGW